MKTKKSLSKREELFCIYFSQSRDLRSSAAKAGYTDNREKTAAKLLCKSNIRERLDELEKKREAQLSEVTEGYRHLAFGSICDAVSLALTDEVPNREDMEKLDLSMISDIKIPKSGGIEIKFFDRLKALDRLCEISSLIKDESSCDFLSALESSARALHSDGEGAE